MGGTIFGLCFLHSAIRMILLLFLSVLRQMIQICEQYAMEYSIAFIPVKSKLMCFNSVSSDKPYITRCGNLHLSNDFYNNIHT